METTWQKEWFAYLSSTTVSLCSCGKTTVLDEWSVIRLSTESCESTEWHAPVTLLFYCCWSYMHRKERVWVNVERESRSNRVILIGIRTEVSRHFGIRTEVSRHFKVIIALGFWDVPTRMSQELGDLNWMIGNK
jgi:hypothetical protein